MALGLFKESVKCIHVGGWFPKIRGTFLGIPIIRIIVFWDLDWDPPIWGNYHVSSATSFIIAIMTTVKITPAITTAVTSFL